MNDPVYERFGASTDVRGNLVKAKLILKKALNSITSARASVSRTDKTFLCDKDYVILSFKLRINLKFFKYFVNQNQDFVNIGLQTSTKTPTNLRKIEKLKSLKEKTFKYKSDIPTDSVSNLIADLHVELIFLYHKISVRLLEYREIPSKAENSNSKENTFEKEFDLLLKECKKNKISQSLLVLSKALNLCNFNSIDQTKLKIEQKSLVEV